MIGICEACGGINKLIRHHWYDTFAYEPPPKTTVKNAPFVLIFDNKPTLIYHEKNICLKCNRLLTQNQIRYFKGGGIKPFKWYEDSHIMPIWEIQKAFVMRQKSIDAKYDEI